MILEGQKNNKKLKTWKGLKLLQERICQQQQVAVGLKRFKLLNWVGSKNNF